MPKVLWKALQKRGWKYKAAPEPYGGSVYVPPGGSVRRGSILGQDFFQADDKLWKHAEKIGIIDTESSSQSDDIEEESSGEDIQTEEMTNVKPQKNPVCVSSPESEDGKLSKKKSCESESVVLDDTKLQEPSYAVTEKSGVKCYSLIEKFLLNKRSERCFMKDLWVPLWNCIKDEQSSNGEGLGWRYDKSRGAGELGRNYWYCPPKSSKGSKGKFGLDYFTTEEAVVSFILRQIKGNSRIQSFISLNLGLVEDFEVRLSRAIEDHITYDEVEGKSVRTSKRRQRNKSASEFSGSPVRKKKKTVAEKSSTANSHSAKTKHITMSPVSQSKPKYLPNDDVLTRHSQNTVKGAEILLELNKSSIDMNDTESAQKYDCIATENGIKALLDRRRSKKRKSPLKSPSNAPLRKKGKTSPPDNSACHLTQAVVDSTLEHWSFPTPAKKGRNERLPFHGFSFFGSGIGLDVANAVTRLGGKFLKDIKGDQLKRNNVVKKLFFISDFINRRTHKYLLANALGVPMLHYEWVFVMEKRLNDYKAQTRNTFPNVFDSKLYAAHRQVFILQLPFVVLILNYYSHPLKLDIVQSPIRFLNRVKLVCATKSKPCEEVEGSRQ